MQERGHDLNPNTGEQIAREVAASRLRDVRQWLERLEQEVETASLYEIEADFQLAGVICRTTSLQMLRVLEASGLLRASAGRLFARDEIAELRQRQEEDVLHEHEGFIPPFVGDDAFGDEDADS